MQMEEEVFRDVYIYFMSHLWNDHYVSICSGTEMNSRDVQCIEFTSSTSYSSEIFITALTSKY